MPNPWLIKEDEILEQQIIETMIEGHRAFRPDLDYPKSHSDMQACVRALMMAFDVKRRPLPKPLRVQCGGCEGLGHLVLEAGKGYRKLDDCPLCNGRGWEAGY